MSADDIAALTIKLERIDATLLERGRTAERNGRILSGLVVAVVMQVICMIYFAGAKVTILERLQADVSIIQAKLDK
jgi:hypothetical protein